MLKLIGALRPSDDATLGPLSAERARDVALALLRVGAGLMMAFSHGLPKVQKLFAAGEVRFADPLGLGAGPSLLLAGGAELVCALLLAAGLLTRVMTVPLAFTMAVAAFVVHADDPFKKQEFALLYLVVFVALFFAGPGRYSFDGWLRRRAGTPDSEV
jgi:putative oxidoreductase